MDATRPDTRPRQAHLFAVACLALSISGAAPTAGQPSSEALRIEGPAERFEGIEAHFVILPFERPVINTTDGYTPVATPPGEVSLPARWTAPVEIVWDFGDGSPAVSTGARVSVSHRYEDDGTYTVKATATGEDGFKAEGSHEVTITNREPTRIRIAATPAVGVEGGIDFTATAQDTPADTLLYHWDFGDGVDVEGEDLWKIRHVYQASGDFSVTLTVRDEDGAIRDKTEEVQVRGPVEQGALPEPIGPDDAPETVVDGLEGKIAGVLTAEIDAEIRSMRGLYLSPIRSGPCRFTFMAWDDALLAHALFILDLRHLTPEGGKYRFSSPLVTLVFEKDAQAYLFNKRQGLGAGGVRGLGALVEKLLLDLGDETKRKLRQRSRNEIGFDPKAREQGEPSQVPSISPFGLDEAARLGDASGVLELVFLPGRYATGKLNLTLQSHEEGPLGGLPVALQNVRFALDLNAAMREGVFNYGCDDGTLEIDARSPEADSQHVPAPRPLIRASFDKRVDSLSLTEDTFEVGYPDAAGDWVPIEGRILVAGYSATFVPEEPLKPGVRYTARFKTEEEGVRGLDGSVLRDIEGDGWQRWSFTTALDFSPTGGSAARLLSCHLFQSVRDPKLIAGKHAMARVYASWPRHADVLPKAQVDSFAANVILTNRRGEELASRQMTFVRPDLWAERGIEIKAAEHTAQVYGFEPTDDLELPLRIKLEVPSEPGKGPKKRYTTVCPGELWDRKPTLTVDYFAIPIYRWDDEEAFGSVGGLLHDLVAETRIYAEQLFPIARLEQRPIKVRLPPGPLIPESPVTVKEGVETVVHPAQLNNNWAAYMLQWSDADIVVGLVPREPMAGGNTKVSGRRAAILLAVDKEPSELSAYVSALVHEMGHALKLPHIPYVETEAQVQETKDLRDSGSALRFEGIEGFRLDPSGSLGWNKSSTEGNEEDETLAPLMYPAVILPDSAFISHHHYLELQRYFELSE